MTHKLIQSGLQSDQVEFSKRSDKLQIATIVGRKKCPFSRFFRRKELIESFDVRPVKNLVAIGIRIAIRGWSRTKQAQMLIAQQMRLL